jgi:hypothetical protein
MPPYPTPPAATSYTIQVSKNNTFTQVVHTGTSTLMSYVPTADMPRNLTLYWHVRASGLNGPGDWSGYATYSTGNPPGIPTLGTPANNTLVTNNPTLDWSQPIIPTGTTFKSYNVEVAWNTNFTTIAASTIITDLSSHSWVVSPGMISSMSYYWHVKSCNINDECNAWSSVRTLRTLIAPPILSLPANRSHSLIYKPLFDWNDPIGATGYTIQISRDQGFTSLVGMYTVSTSTYTPTYNLPARTLYWRIRANGSNGPSLWTNAWKLTVP